MTIKSKINSAGKPNFVPRILGSGEDWGRGGDLPDDVSRSTLEFLHADDVRRVGEISHPLSRVAEEPLLWKKLVHRDYSNAPKVAPSGGWKAYYREHRTGLSKARDFYRECNSPGFSMGVWRNNGERVELGHFALPGSIPATRTVLSYHHANGIKFYLPHRDASVNVKWDPMTRGASNGRIGYSISGAGTWSLAQLELIEDSSSWGMQQTFGVAFEIGDLEFGFIKYKNDGAAKWIKSFFQGSS
ncbi:MAG: hypothetical protein VYA34_02375 [Myxococcota bacterium]|nr:hypothetical protein [Myxococcota bacterium]